MTSGDYMEEKAKIQFLVALHIWVIDLLFKDFSYFVRFPLVISGFNTVFSIYTHASRTSVSLHATGKWE